jgi:hypothetical protein
MPAEDESSGLPGPSLGIDAGGSTATLPRHGPDRLVAHAPLPHSLANQRPVPAPRPLAIVPAESVALYLQGHTSQFQIDFGN